MEQPPSKFEILGPNAARRSSIIDTRSTKDKNILVVIPLALSETQNLYGIDALETLHQPTRLRKGYAVLLLIREFLLPKVNSIVYKSESILMKRRASSIE